MVEGNSIDWAVIEVDMYVSDRKSYDHVDERLLRFFSNLNNKNEVFSILYNIKTPMRELFPKSTDSKT